MTIGQNRKTSIPIHMDGGPLLAWSGTKEPSLI